MRIWPAMHRDSESGYLPTELLLLVAQFLDNIDEDDSPDEYLLVRQKTFHSFCLVSRQWYSVGIGFLYRCPSFARGNSFAKFANTLCPPKGVRKGNVDLGSMVETLSMAGLVHHSTNSLTARLLGRTKKSLKSFVAPRVSFAVNCLPALSKCQNLVILNLSLVSGTSIPFPRLKKAICNLPKLTRLELPSSMSLTRTDDVGQWPPYLRSVRVGGALDPDVMVSFEWPPSITELSIRKCTDLSTNVLESVLQNGQLRVRLQGLELHNSNEEMCTDQFSDVLYTLPNLIYLKIPLDLTEDLLILPTPVGLPALPIRALELTEPYFEAPPDFDFADELIVALSRNLSNVWAFGISHKCVHMVEGKGKGKKIEEALWKHIEEGDDKELDKLDDLGLYTLNDDA